MPKCRVATVSGEGLCSQCSKARSTGRAEVPVSLASTPTDTSQHRMKEPTLRTRSPSENFTCNNDVLLKKNKHKSMSARSGEASRAAWSLLSTKYKSSSCLRRTNCCPNRRLSWSKV
ncbi:hypothetical protein E2C01_036930 [Portunus trituberculatus]|uniref:Uncharacterized protein n=1 Tax=Portunus trituberculatus TaxID=210409 RepID=A0A5B7FE06_PORTR|nr:hypothetical protein [Portunus trituberculatus]